MSQRFDSIEFYRELENRPSARVREFEAHRFRQWWRVWFQRAPACARQRTGKPGLAWPAFGARPSSAGRPAFSWARRRHGNSSGGSQQQFRVSGQPMFDQACRYLGYRGIGVEIMTGH